MGRNRFAYVFEINNNTYNDQHIILYYNLAGGCKKVAFYALPAICTSNELSNALPNLLAHTYHVDVADISPFLVDNQKHQIHLYPNLRKAYLCSEKEKEIEAISSEELVGLIGERKIGTEMSAMIDNMKRRVEEFTIRSKRPRFLFTIFPGF